jgi:hypothetical protein
VLASLRWMSGTVRATDQSPQPSCGGTRVGRNAQDWATGAGAERDDGAGCILRGVF